jgi:AGZA family xanthine/uracil permease-like MFS transporter
MQPATFANPPRRSLAEDVYAGLALFFSMYYVLSLNPKILEGAGLPHAATLAATLAVILAGNLTGIALTRTGLMIAPAIGISSFVASFVQSIHNPQMFNGSYVMLSCVLAGVALVLTSWLFPTLRTRIIEELPAPVRKGASAAIGSLLVKKSFDLFNDCVAAGVGRHFAIAAVALGVFIIVLFFLLRTGARRDGWRQLALRSEFVLVVVTILILLLCFQPAYYKRLPRRIELAFLWQDLSGFAAAANPVVTGCLTLVLAAIIWFIVVADIPGTPVEVLPADMPDRDTSIRRGFFNDSLWALLSPLFGTTPTIYYAENNILRAFQPNGAGGTYFARAGYITVALFALLLAGALAAGVSLERIIPPFATVPILMFIGIYIISASLLPKGSEPASYPSLQYHIPTAIAIILTPRLGIEYSFPLTALSFLFVRNPTERVEPTFLWVLVGSGVCLVVSCLVLSQS